MKTKIKNKLTSYIKKLKIPSDYLKGSPPFTMELASNILLFSRTNSSELLGTRMHHHRYVLIINIKTEATVIINSMHIHFKPEDILLIHPHEFHHFIDAKEKKIEWLFVTFEFKHDTFRLETKNNIIKASNSFWKYIDELISIYDDKNQNNKTILCTTLIVNELLKSKKTDKYNIEKQEFEEKDNLISKINNYIYLNLKSGIDISDIAKKFCFSKSHIRLIYRTAMGISIGKYIKEIRTNEAEKLLANSNMNISEIAYKCGFESLFSFSRYFKTNTGITPTSYRKNISGNKV